MKPSRNNKKARSGNSKSAQSPRLLALKALGEVLDEGRFLTECAALKDDENNRNLPQARHLAYGVLRWLVALAWLEAQLLDKPLRQKDRDISRVIWLGMFQLWQDSTPDHAAINETTEVARSLGKSWAVNMINAVLRRFQREQASLLERLSKTPEQLAHPSWLLAATKTDWPEQWQSILEANNAAAPLWLRVNTQRSTRENLAASLGAAGFNCETNEYAPHALLISPAAAVTDLPGFKEGLFSVQDAAAQLAAELLDAQPGMRVLDACAAPGGKTCHLLERVSGIQLTAVERYTHRLQRVQENLDRLGLHAHLVAADATKSDLWWDGKLYDRILLDAPCSATGVIRRHPEIRHLRDPEQVQEAIATQFALLQHLWPLLSIGGKLLYATCSFFVDENSNQIKRFISENADAEDVPIPAAWGLAQTHGRQILPGESNMDGFYYACLRKRH